MQAHENTRRVVVVGATGNIGTSVVNALDIDQAIGSIVSLSRREPPVTSKKTRWERTDIREDDLVARFASADVVIHLIS
ncbi:NAD-dependent epimerase/dehydratase family protein [Saccharopolyspora sp. ASAGF58]|uniref:NAD-dependent epimerase/dehydratase family protein n=1 Tax=Saccharopolyspora sp. ASAGF58 TaxID=2719023 RepID=UPI00353036C0